MMRTTVDLDDTVVAAARSLARARGISLGAAISELALRGLTAAAEPSDVSYSPFPVLTGDPQLIVTDELVADLRDA